VDPALGPGFYYSLLDWQHPDAYEMALPAYPPTGAPRDQERYKAYIRAHTQELLANYGPLSTMWFDYSDETRQGAAWGAGQLMTDMRAAQPGILVNNRLFFGLENRNGDYGTPEKYVPPTGIPGMDWEFNHTLNESCGFSSHDMNWKDTATVVRLLCDIVSKGGNLLLNVGPDAQGRIPAEAARTLRGVGAWMRVNGEAIYGTTASPFARLPWGAPRSMVP
jgi:alpha-L-fucosidase